jgi:putative PIG3 family NAD(P)H quinone oxidoreductase
MRAVVIEDTRLRVAERPDPEPGHGELLVRVAAAGLNGADLMQLAGRYPAPPGAPADIPGLELAGTVEAVGPGVRRFGPGDRVMAIAAGGGHAELISVHERIAMPVPDGVELGVAGAVPETFTTAHDALFTQAGLKLGERLLVHGAAGGVGTAAVQLGVRAGARVTATVRNPDHRAAVAAFGAEVLAPGEEADAGPFDVILELVGAPNFPGNQHVLAHWGRIMVIGVGGGAKVELDLQRLMTTRGRIMASTLRVRPLEEKAAAARRVESAVLPALAAGELTVPIEATFPLADAQAAYDRFKAGSKLGKIVLVPDAR